MVGYSKIFFLWGGMKASFLGRVWAGWLELATLSVSYKGVWWGSGMFPFSATVESEGWWSMIVAGGKISESICVLIFFQGFSPWYVLFHSNRNQHAPAKHVLHIFLTREIQSNPQNQELQNGRLAMLAFSGRDECRDDWKQPLENTTDLGFGCWFWEWNVHNPLQSVNRT